ncbi:FG-GAP repeat domain-containing protein [Micromonospora vulcania]|uniref:FG-GAP repeat domain-containing protein n=1 Tax=Micromonospora vulcania TaxID=1441873 RepID=A0ABW1H1H7_9ACTN
MTTISAARSTHGARWTIALAVATAVAGVLGAPPAPVFAAVSVGVGDVFAVDTHGGSGMTEVHALSRSGNYQSFTVHAATSLGPTDVNQWTFGFGDYDADGLPDLFAVNTADTNGQKTAAHVLSGASNFQNALLHVQLPAMGGANLDVWQFAVGDYNADGRADLYGINTRDNNGQNTAAHVWDGANNLNSFLLHAQLTAMGGSDLAVWQFAVGDHNADGRADLYGINTRDGGNTAAHIWNAADNLHGFLLHSLTPLPASDLAVWQYTTTDYDGDGRADLAAINTRDAGSNSTAIHVLSASSNLRTFAMQTGTALNQSQLSKWQFHGWSGRRGGGTVSPNPYGPSEVTIGWTPRMQYVVNQLNAAHDPRFCGGQADGSGSGHINGSDHYSGNAADCFAAGVGAIATGGDKALGDAMADWAVRNAAALRVKYVIWYARIYNVQSSNPRWEYYCNSALTAAQCANPSPGDPATLQHMDHVHISVIH